MYETDIITTTGEDLVITFLNHGSLMFTFGDRVIHADPVDMFADYSALPKADLVLVTHEHHDHLDSQLIDRLRVEETVVLCSESCAGQIRDCTVMKNGDMISIFEMKIEAVPAYNIVHMRSPGTPYHPKGVGNGYVITFNDQRVYIAGDTENTPEMKALASIDVAFLPMNLPYTMDPEMVADAAKAFRPRVLYPYHYGSTNPKLLVDLLKDFQDINVRIRDMK